MKIFAIGNNNISFKQNPQNAFSLGLLTGVESSTDVFVSNEFNKNQKEKTAKLSSMVYDRFSKNYDNKIENIEKFANPYNKALTLNNLAHSYYQSGEIEKAGVVLASSFNALNKDLGLWEDDKNKLIEKKENLDLLKDFFYCSNNSKAKFFVMKSLNDLNKPIFLPIAEDVCECDEDTTTINDKRTIYEARKFINKNYDLNQLNNYLDKEDFYKTAVLGLLSKWGLEDHSSIATKLCEDSNLQIQAQAQNLLSKLKQLSTYNCPTSINLPPKSMIELPSTQFFDLKNTIITKKTLKTLKYVKNEIDLKDLLLEITKTEDIMRSIDLINLLGDRGYLTKHAELIKPQKDENKTLTRVKALAFMKICIRNNWKLNN